MCLGGERPPWSTQDQLQGSLGVSMQPTSSATKGSLSPNFLIVKTELRLLQRILAYIYFFFLSVSDSTEKSFEKFFVGWAEGIAKPCHNSTAGVAVA